MGRNAKSLRRCSKTSSISSNHSTEDQNHFNVHDRAILNEINNSIKELKEISVLKLELCEAKNEIAHVKAENAQLKQAVNINLYNHDNLDQYNRRENIRIYGIPESSDKRDMGKMYYFRLLKNSTSISTSSTFRESTVWAKN